MKDRINKIIIGITGKMNEMLISFSVSFTLVIILYVIINEMGIFGSLDNERVIQLMWCCLAVAIVHALLNLIETKVFTIGILYRFFAMVAVVLFMGIVVYKWFPMDATFFVYLVLMLTIVFLGTFLIVYLDEVKQAYEINQMIQKRRENRKDKK